MPNLQSDNHTRFRLPTEVKPSHYDILIKTDLEKLEFQGIVTIDLDVKSDTGALIFNSANISITTVSVTYIDGDAQKINLDKLTFDESLERATLALPAALKRGSKAALSIHYKSPLTDDLRGRLLFSMIVTLGIDVFVFQVIIIPSMKSKVRSVTARLLNLRSFVDLVKPTAARRALPCWDEPAFKATFEISMISRNETLNLSNMPVVSETKVLSSSAGQFFADDNFDGWKITKFERTPMTTKFCLDIKAKALIQYEQAFGIEFALPKLDTVVGLIIGQTSALLVDPERADLAKKQNIAETQSHEVAHMLFPEWNVYSSFYNSQTEALSSDAKLSSHPIQVDTPNPDEIGQIVLRMLSIYTGEEKFLRGVSIYLKNHLYGNTVAADLWAGIKEATGLDISGLMNNWTSKVLFNHEFKPYGAQYE
ncbi:hypothetical protein Clacol_004398 [Clathrus columnatus]|uniref:Peptidase M1 membrane alanine aminopeptidase domain-containing protein n=1 Tax=Clathrus columnatus TaxID=1419009 RepID=A0AAV5A6D8_9AGAM|nr:hypothetical protein Clacol_004398 [Clathrus columnatus]